MGCTEKYHKKGKPKKLPLNDKTKTTIRPVQWESGPYQTEEEAWAAKNIPSWFTVIKVFREREDRWWALCCITSTTMSSTLPPLES